MDKKCDLCLWNQGSGGGGGGGSSTLSGLTDVDISNPSNGQTLVYNATSGKWENGAGGGGANVIPVFTLNRTSATGGTATCDMTFDSIMAAIQSGTLTGAKFVIEEGVYQYAAISFFSFTSDEMSGPYVTFAAYEVLDGAGNISWNLVSMTAQEIEYTVIETHSYPGT